MQQETPTQKTERLIREIAQQYGEAEFDDWPRWQRACQAWQTEQKRSMH